MTAHEARQLSDAHQPEQEVVNSWLDVIYQKIRKTATDTKNRNRYITDVFSDVKMPAPKGANLEEIINILETKDRYNVEVLIYSNDLKISW